MCVSINNMGIADLSQQGPMINRAKPAAVVFESLLATRKNLIGHAVHYGYYNSNNCLRWSIEGEVVSMVSIGGLFLTVTIHNAKLSLAGVDIWPAQFPVVLLLHQNGGKDALRSDERIPVSVRIPNTKNTDVRKIRFETRSENSAATA
jgi:hypothetical protein